MAVTKRKLSTRKAVATPEFSDGDGHDAPPPTTSLSSRHGTSYHSTCRVAELRNQLLGWYDGVKSSRGMPWRKPYDPSLGKAERAQRAYEVWVSEIMLQQTQVATVIPYYQKWLAQFPTLPALAKSDIETVNGIWKGLGYYRRAKVSSATFLPYLSLEPDELLFEGAKKVHEEFGGRLPEDVKKMEKDVPGVGKYTAGAISSIAYNIKAPVIDGNVHRLLTRLLALHSQPKSKQTLDVLWSAASELVQTTEHPGDWNQALIELGSTVCKPRDPKCGDCPLREGCGAWLESQGRPPTKEATDIEDLCMLCEPFPEGSSKDVTRYPMKVERKKAREEESAVNVVEWKGNSGSWFLLARRPEKGLLGGLWEFPTLDLPGTATTSASLLRTPNTLLSSLLKDPEQVLGDSLAEVHYERPPLVIGEVLHIFSHIRKVYHALWVVLEGGDEPPALALAGQPVAKKRKVADGSEGGTKWVKEADVDGSTIGQGLVKVWSLVQAARSGKPLPEPTRKKTAPKKAKGRKKKAVSDDEDDSEDEWQED